MKESYACNSENKNLERVELTQSCADAAEIPKVVGAGEVFEQDGCQIQRMHNGTVIHAGSYHGEWMTELIKQLGGHHEPQEEKVFHAVLQCLEPGATMIELGCFWAYYSIWFQSEIANSRSILVEPEPEKLRAGKENFALNEFEGTFIHAFAGSHEMERSEFVDWDGSRNFLPMVSIDSLMEKYGVEILDVLHSDIQGAETEMLKGAAQALAARKIKYVFISTHAGEHRKSLRLIKRYGYRIIAEHTVLESFSGDGLIVAASPECLNPPAVVITKKKVSLIKKVRYELGCVKQMFSPVG
ncbi:MAG: FkbM family methyltransferase [Verrucomicrobiales bacterium]|nr:FkbM family methyltransferase [Verrucomicrobiales bacterium]